MCEVMGRRFIIKTAFDPLAYENVCMITSLPTKRILSISNEKHLPEFYPQDGGESQLAPKLRHCHPIDESGSKQVQFQFRDNKTYCF